jgi:serine/threonine protein kinase/tetratricopeptide (TPR) repeat protein
MPAEHGKPPTREVPPIPTGAVVADKYVVETVLGTGAMGYVVAARHKLIGQRVAIKFIKSSYVDDADALERFMREARTLVAVQSENVVRVLDYGKMPDASPYLVMELLAGRDLLAELRARGPLPLGEAAEIVLQACEGLAAVHARGIVHRDVKPANLFLTTRANGKLLVKIVDFGISKAPKLNDEELSLTRSSLGSPHYMSPEQLRSARTVDARSDVWSLGVTLHRTLTGELPFGGESVGSLMAAVMTDSPRPLRSLRPDLPAEMEAIIKRCLEKNAEDRFGSAQELADALAPFAMPSDRRPSEPPPPEVVSPSPFPSEPPPSRESTTTNAHVSQARGTDPFADARRRRAVLAAAIGVPLIGAALALAFAPRGGHAPVTPTLKATASTAIMITDAPAPKTNNPEAAAAYQSGLQAVRDGSMVAALERFERAAALDPTMAAAELRSAIYGDSDTGSVPRRHARTAIALRASLTESDRDLLHAIEPIFVPPHPDLVESRRRFDALVAARPQDAELVFVAAIMLMNTRPRAEMRAMCDRALQLDPKFAGALWMRGLIEELEWDRPAVLRTVEQCTTLSPAAASCLRLRANLESVLGECAAFEADAKRMLAMEAVTYRAYDFLATALFARGESIDAVREALRLKWKASSDEERPAVQLSDEANLAIATGDFAAALKDAHDLEGLAEASGNEADRIAAAKLRIELHTELGQPIVAAQVADAYLKRMGAWPGRDSIDDDPRPTFYAAAVRGGLRTPSERDAVHSEWVATWNAEVEPLEKPRVWLQGYAEPTQTREEAELALSVVNEYSPLPTIVIPGAIGWTAPSVGKVYALAGHPDQALAQLKLAASSCRTLGEPGEITRARFYLGEALEATGDAAGACAAYEQVLGAWGSEKRSVTANAARAHAASLACPGAPMPK